MKLARLRAVGSNSLLLDHSVHYSLHRSPETEDEVSDLLD